MRLAVYYYARKSNFSNLNDLLQYKKSKLKLLHHKFSGNLEACSKTITYHLYENIGMPSLENILSVFNSSPIACLILFPDAPKYTVAGVNQAFLQSVGVSRGDIIGKGVFEAFIENRDDTASKSGQVVLKSLEQALYLKKAHKVRRQRYDTQINGSEEFDVRYWNWDTYPVLDENNEVQFIIHNPEEVTDRIKLINDEKERYKNLFNASPLPMWVYDYETLRFLDLNDAAIKHYGYSKEEFLSMTLKDIRPKEDILKLETILKNHVKPGRYNSSSVRHLKKSGEIIYVNIESNAILFNNRDARIVLASDVTEVHKAEQALIESEQRFKALVQNGSDLITILDSTGKLKYVSPTSKLVLGVEAKRFYGKKVLDFIHEDDRKMVKYRFLMLSKQKSVKIPAFRFKVSCNNYKWLETIVTDMTDDAAVGGIVTNSRDVTQSIQNDIKIREGIERYKIVSKATNDAIYDWDTSSNKVTWNIGMQRIFGYKRQTCTPEWWNDLIHPEDWERIEKQIEYHIKNNKPRWKAEYRFKCADGLYKVVLDRGFYVYDDSKQLVR
ncbi:MAG: PAS domain S-box protein, partial [Sphingobacteriaceae bacterium]